MRIPIAVGLSLISLVMSIVTLALMMSFSRHYSEGHPYNNPTQTVIQKQQELSDCVTKALADTKPAVVDVSLYEQVSQFCGHQVYALDRLNDFNVRMEKFSRQEFDERIIVWMVVAITISGVCLAGLQLLASYQLASIGRGGLAEDSVISLEKGKISLKSSVTGLIILVVSLAFFMVYVKWVYPFQNVTVAMPSDEQPTSIPYVPLQGRLGTLNDPTAPIYGRTPSPTAVAPADKSGRNSTSSPPQ